MPKKKASKYNNRKVVENSNNNKRSTNSLTQSDQDVQKQPDSNLIINGEVPDGEGMSISKSIDWIKPKGLQNLGNTCFYNATMQCLLNNTHLLQQYFNRVKERTRVSISQSYTVKLGEQHIKIPKADIELPLPPLMPMHFAFRKFVEDFIAGKQPNPRQLYDQISKKVPRFRGWNQQDAHELLIYFMDNLRMEEINNFEQGFNEYIDNNAIQTEDKERMKKSLCKVLLEGPARPILDAVFGGQLEQTLFCYRCFQTSVSIEPFFVLSLPLHNRVVSVRTMPMVYEATTSQENGGASSQKINAKSIDETPIVLTDQNGKMSKHQMKKMRKDSKRKTQTAKRLNKRQKSIGDKNEDNPEGHEQIGNTGEEDATYEKESKINGINKESDEKHQIGERSISIMKRGGESRDVVRPLIESDDLEGNNDCLSISAILASFTAIEHLDPQSSAYRCGKCAEAAKRAGKKPPEPELAHKRYLVLSPPLVLTLHLKRFEQTGLRSMKKFNGHVRFETLLDLAPFCSDQVKHIVPGQRNLYYSLYGVVCHAGGLSGGHYIAFVRSRPQLDGKRLAKFFDQATNHGRLTATEEAENLERLLRTLSMNGNHPNLKEKDESIEVERERALREHEENLRQTEWFLCSDLSVHRVSVDQVLAAQAYMLFYDRFF